MPKHRTTGCAQNHFGSNCADCTRVRVRRFRARHRGNSKIPLPITDDQRLANSAASYVREYLRRGAIAPPDACERCELETQISPSRPLRRLRPWHPDPAMPRLVAWLCVDCRRLVRATREPITLTWQWPGLTAARSRKPANLPQVFATATAAVGTKLLPSAAPSFRKAALMAIFVAALAPGERERLYGAGCLAGPRWRPTSDAVINALLCEWVYAERAERSRIARAAGGTTVTPAAVPRRRRREVSPPAEQMPRQPFDADAAWAAIQGALRRLDEADIAAQQTIERVNAAIRSELKPGSG